MQICIPLTRRVKEYTMFVEKYVTGRRKRSRPYKVYIVLARCHAHSNARNRLSLMDDSIFGARDSGERQQLNGEMKGGSGY